MWGEGDILYLTFELPQREWKNGKIRSPTTYLSFVRQVKMNKMMILFDTTKYAEVPAEKVTEEEQ